MNFVNRTKTIRLRFYHKKGFLRDHISNPVYKRVRIMKNELIEPISEILHVCLIPQVREFDNV